jgi:hypothetical protein
MLPNTLPTFPSGATVTRPASGGVQPYTYTSANSQIAAVNTTGLISVRSNGSTTITARDSSGQSKQVTVTVRNVFSLTAIGATTWEGANGYQPPGGHLPSRNELRAVYNQYQNKWPLDMGFWWSSEYYGPDLLGKRYWGLTFSNGSDNQQLNIFYNPGLGIVPT